MNEQAGTAIGSGDGRLFVAPSPEELNRVLPHFEVETLIGQGGMGAVYKARQPKLDRFVAIKVVPALLTQSEHNFAERFEREARAMAGLNHPHIVTVHDFGETENGYLYIVMEYVDGRDMHHAIVSRETGVNEALVWMVQLCDAVQYAHEHDIVHRDIKPANILINKEGQVKVGDFGLVKLVGRKREAAITLSQVAMGTPDYSAPESLEEGGSVDHRADLYSMGVLLYELLTGKVPRGAWKPPSAFVRVNPRLDQIVVKAMQPDPEQRYQSAAQLKEAIVGVQAMGAQTKGEDVVMAIPADRKTPVTARGVLTKNSGSEVLVKRRRRRGRPLAQAMLALFLIAATVGGIFVLATRTGALRLPYFGMAGHSDPSREPAPVSSSIPAPVPGKQTAAPGSGEAGSGLRLVGVEEGWVDMMSSLQFPRDLVSGRWQIQGKSMRSRIQKGTDRSRLRIPVLLDSSFEVELDVIYQKEVVPFALTLPLRAGPVPLLIGEAGLPNEPRFLVIGGGGTLRNGNGEATRRVPVSLNPSGHHVLTVKVMNRSDEVGILVTMDGREAGRFVGAVSDFLPGGEKKPEVFSRQLVFGAEGDLEVRNFRVRSLSSKEWFPEPVGPGKKAVPVVAKVDAKAAVAPTPAEQKKLWTEAIRQRITDVGSGFDQREAEIVRASYDVEVANLREKYNAALNREILPKDDSISVKAAVQRELMRIRQGEHVEATDPPEMPEIVKKARAIYRQELAKLDEQMNLALAPMLREHLENLNSLEGEKVAAGQCTPEGKTLLVEARGRVERRLEGVRAFLDTLENSRKPGDGSALPGNSPSQPVDPKAAPANLTETGPLPLPRKEKLSPATRPRGRIEVWPRLEPVREATVKFEWGNVPSGLGNSVVAIAGAPGAALALKSSGRAVIWGALVSEELQNQVGKIDGVAAMTVATNRTWIGLGFLMENGTARFVPEMVDVPAAGPADKGVTDLIDVVVVPEAGIGLRQTGDLMAWGKAGASYRTPDRGIASIHAHVTALIALKTDGSLLSLGGAGALESSLAGPYRAIALGTQPAFGMVAQRRDGSVAAFGSFAPLQVALQTYASQHKIARMVGGFEAFAVLEEGGGWAFFGANLDTARLEKVAKGCRDLVIGRDEVIGLQTM